MAINKMQRKIRRQKRTRAKYTGTTERPRVSVHRTNKFIYAQVIDDTAAKTLAAVSSAKVEKTEKITKLMMANEVGKQLAEELKKLNILKVVFDRGSFVYKGRVKALAEGLRENGIEV